MSVLDKTDWALFRQQKALLVELASDTTRMSPEEILLLDGTINLLDYVQDEFEPESSRDYYSPKLKV